MMRLIIILFFTCLSVSAQTYRPGDIVLEEHLHHANVATFFRCTPIPDSIFRAMQGKSYKHDCTVPRSDLRYLTCLHRNAEGKTVVGEMVVNKSIATTVLKIFRQLYDAAYPIERMRLIDLWDADDERSMRDNNSSSFNFRFMTGSTTHISKHGYGLAIDINTRYNPYYRRLSNGKEIIQPKNGVPYIDRTRTFPYKIVKGDLLHHLFTQNGFTWGGSWTSCKDYQHFEK